MTRLYQLKALLLPIVSDLNNIAAEIEDEGDRAWLGSTNDADRLKEIAATLDNWRFEEATRPTPAPAAMEGQSSDNLSGAATPAPSTSSTGGDGTARLSVGGHVGRTSGGNADVRGFDSSPAATSLQSYPADCAEVAKRQWLELDPHGTSVIRGVPDDFYGKDPRISIFDAKPDEGELAYLTIGLFVGGHQWVMQKFTPEQAVGIVGMLLSKRSVQAALAALGRSA
jgi:hypothetical protein